MEKEKDLGALWVKSSTKGQYMTGTIEVNGEKINVVCFLNSNKKEAKHPDWRVMKAVPRDTTQKENPLPTKEDLVPLTAEDLPF